MDALQTLMRFAQANPAIAGGAVAVLLILGYLLMRKSKLSRAADAELDRLRQKRGDYYNSLRPPR